MNLSFQIIAAGVAVIVFAVIGILLLTPAQKSKRRRINKDGQENPSEPVKDWQGVSLRLERHIQALRREIEEYQKKERLNERELAVQKEKYTKLQDKLAQERDWQKREEEDIDKKAKEIEMLKTNLRKTESDLNATHSERLRFEREVREVKFEAESLNQIRRNLELKVQTLEAQVDSLHKQVKELKWENAKLSEKKDAESWVPKGDFEKLEVELRNKEKDLARLREQIKKEVL